MTGQQYPIYWRHEVLLVNPQFATASSSEAVFRLPAVTYSGPAASQLFVQPPVTSVVVGSLASTLAKKPGIYLQNFKPYLKIGVPYYCQERHEWEPILQLPGEQQLSLYWVRRALQAILTTLTPSSTLPDTPLKVGAVDLTAEVLAAALAQLEGVVLGCPANWGDTYQINLREAVLEAKLVKEAQQVFFLEDAIATILTTLPRIGTGGEMHSFSNLTPCPGSMLAINAGATTTELVLADLPDQLEQLTYKNFYLHSWSYGGHGIDQDIFWQLLYPQLSREQLQQLSLSEDLELPLPGQSDQPKRDRASSQLQSSPFGQALLRASGYLKLILQHKAEFTLQLGAERWTVKRQDFEAKVLVPFIEQFNRELNALLIETGISGQLINRIVCMGGTTAFSNLQKWLQQKLPNTTLILEADLPQGSSVAAGLAALPLYPQVLNRAQQQYSDYFLLLELLRAFANPTEEPADRLYSIEEIMQHLERRGLNASACYQRLILLIEGRLPPGLVPSVDYGSWLSPASCENLHYCQAKAAGLFSQEGDRLYRPNPEQHERLHQYMDALLSSMYQTFEEPLIVNLEAAHL
ncbi:MAG TPA: hypothetical protein DC064_17105 [Cyanobacteria bacterium UBA9273]|nr:hypothetical protein [Cyanobacteria bacterium UBA9273]